MSVEHIFKPVYLLFAPLDALILNSLNIFMQVKIQDHKQKQEILTFEVFYQDCLDILQFQLMRDDLVTKYNDDLRKKSFEILFQELSQQQESYDRLMQNEKKLDDKLLKDAKSDVEKTKDVAAAAPEIIDTEIIQAGFNEKISKSIDFLVKHGVEINTSDPTQMAQFSLHDNAMAQLLSLNSSTSADKSSKTADDSSDTADTSSDTAGASLDTGNKNKTRDMKYNITERWAVLLARLSISCLFHNAILKTTDKKDHYKKAAASVAGLTPNSM